MKKHFFTMTFTFLLLMGVGTMNSSIAQSIEQRNPVSFEIKHHHVAISVPNAEESAAWYKKMFGFEVVTKMTQGESDKKMFIVHIRRGNCYIELFQVTGAKALPEYRRDPTADLGVHGTVHFAFQVSDVPAAVKELKAKGAEIAMGPVDTPGVAFVFIRDNAGNTFELIQYKN
jgi:methylmalonyl-CoA/ethylmalonyl-CoA epimerase